MDGAQLEQALEGTTVEQVVDALRTRPEHEFFAYAASLPAHATCATGHPR